MHAFVALADKLHFRSVIMANITLTDFNGPEYDEQMVPVLEEIFPCMECLPPCREYRAAEASAVMDVSTVEARSSCAIVQVR